MFKITFTLSILIFCSSCASTSTFRPYTSQIDPVIEKIRNNSPINFNKEFSNKINSKDKALYLLERGRIAQIKGDIYLSKQSFQAAEETIRQMDKKAILSASGGAAQASSILVNDNALPYRVAGYERVMLHHYQALNYLYENNLEGAAVEIRKANAQQEASLRDHRKELENTKISAQRYRVSSEIPETVSNAYSRLDSMVGDLKNSFQNAYTFYLSGIIYEMMGQPNDAYIDYKKALEIYPYNQFLQKDVIRLAQALENVVNQKPSKTGELIVLFEDDFIPQKQEIKIPIPISLENPNFIAVAFPIYNIEQIDSFPLLLYENGQVMATTEPICDLTSIAVKALKEKVSAIVTHQLIRVASKAILAKQVERELGDIGSLAVSAYNVFSENADLRSWLTLPANAQIMRMSVPEGDHEFVFLQKELGANAYIRVHIKENTKKIIRIVRAGIKLYYINLT